MLFRTVNFNFREQVDRALREGGVELTFAQSSALSLIHRQPGINGAEIARLGMVSAQAMNVMLRQLAARKLVERRAHPESQRADAWHLTPAGRIARTRARAIFGGVMSRMLAPLTTAQVRQFERYLQLCAASLE